MFKHLSSGEKVVMAFAVITLPLVVLAVYAFTASAARGMVVIESKNLEAIASIQKNRIVNLTNVYGNIVQSVASDNALRTAVERGSLSDIERLLRDIRAANGIVKSVSVLDVQGGVVSSTNPGVVGLNYEDTAFFASAKEFTVVSGIVRDTQNQLEIELGGPIISGNKTIGVVRITTYPDQILAITSDYNGLRNTGETLIVNATRSGEAQFLTPKRFDGGLNVERLIPSSQRNDAVFPALAGREAFFGSQDTVDYRNKAIFASTRFIDELDWGVVVKIDQEEVLQPVYRARSLLLGFSALIYGVVLIVWVLFVRKSKIFKTQQSFQNEVSQSTQSPSTLQAGQQAPQIFHDAQKGDELSRLSQSLHTIATSSKSLPESEKSDLDRLAVVLGAVASQYQQLASVNQVVK